MDIAFNSDMRYRENGWWRDHYSGHILELWHSIIPPHQAREDADYIIANCGLHSGQRVLDVPCGEGRVAIELALRGLKVTGIDISPGQIEVARNNSTKNKVDINWQIGEMRSLSTQVPFDAAICWGDSFGYLDDIGNEDFLRAIHQSLRKGGRLAMEMQTIAELVLPKLAHTYYRSCWRFHSCC